MSNMLSNAYYEEADLILFLLERGLWGKEKNNLQSILIKTIKRGNFYLKLILGTLRPNKGPIKLF